MVDFLPFFISFARLVATKDRLNRKNCIFIFLNSFRSVCGKILTLTLEARAKLLCLYILLIFIGFCTTLSIVQSPPSESFNALIHKSKSVRFEQRIKVLFANWPFLKSY